MKKVAIFALALLMVAMLGACASTVTETIKMPIPAEHVKK